MLLGNKDKTSLFPGVLFLNSFNLHLCVPRNKNAKAIQNNSLPQILANTWP